MKYFPAFIALVLMSLLFSCNGNQQKDNTDTAPKTPEPIGTKLVVSEAGKGASECGDMVVLGCLGQCCTDCGFTLDESGCITGCEVLCKSVPDSCTVDPSCQYLTVAKAGGPELPVYPSPIATMLEDGSWKIGDMQAARTAMALQYMDMYDPVTTLKFDSVYIETFNTKPPRYYMAAFGVDQYSYSIAVAVLLDKSE